MPRYFAPQGAVGSAALGVALALGLAPTPRPMSAQGPVGPSPVLRAMKDELTRNFTALKSQPTAPYFISYEITDIRSASVSSAFGALGSSADTHRRQLDITLRVGGYDFDNTHAVRGMFGVPTPVLDRFGGFTPVPVDDDPAGIKTALWYETDRRYKAALEQPAAARTNAGQRASRCLRRDRRPMRRSRYAAGGNTRDRESCRPSCTTRTRRLSPSTATCTKRAPT
jgi:hypothetical protein